MGQQQVILIILVTIILGIATVVAVNLFAVNVKQANRDNVRQDLSNAATYVQAIWERPILIGGANRRFTSLDEEIILQYLNIPATEYQPGDTEASNENGIYRVQIENDTELIIIGEPDSGPPDIQITVRRDTDTGQWTYEFSDVSEDN